MRVIECMESHRYRGARADNTLARFEFDSSDGNMRVPPIVRSESARLEPLGRVVMTYLFIKFAEFSLETRRLISFVIVSSYRQDHLRSSSSMQSPFMPCRHDVVSGSSHLRLSLRRSHAGRTGQLLSRPLQVPWD